MKAHLIKAFSCIFLTAVLLISQVVLQAQHYDFSLTAGEKTPDWLADKFAPGRGVVDAPF